MLCLRRWSNAGQAGRVNYNAKSPKHGKKTFDSITKTIHFAHLGILFIYVPTHEEGVADDVGGGVHGVPPHLCQVHPRHQVTAHKQTIFRNPISYLQFLDSNIIAIIFGQNTFTINRKAIIKIWIKGLITKVYVISYNRYLKRVIILIDDKQKISVNVNFFTECLKITRLSRWVQLSEVQNSPESSWVINRTALSQAKHGIGYHWALLNAVRGMSQSKNICTVWK